MAEPLNLFILTGAGISAESGLSTFRDADGLWTQNDLAKLATPEGFASFIAADLTRSRAAARAADIKPE